MYGIFLLSCHNLKTYRHFCVLPLFLFWTNFVTVSKREFFLYYDQIGCELFCFSIPGRWKITIWSISRTKGRTSYRFPRPVSPLNLIVHLCVGSFPPPPPQPQSLYIIISRCSNSCNVISSLCYKEPWLLIYVCVVSYNQGKLYLYQLVFTNLFK